MLSGIAAIATLVSKDRGPHWRDGKHERLLPGFFAVCSILAAGLVVVFGIMSLVDALVNGGDAFQFFEGKLVVSLLLLASGLGSARLTIWSVRTLRALPDRPMPGDQTTSQGA